MQVLLDTNAFLWWVTNDPKLSAEAKIIISNPQNQTHNLPILTADSKFSLYNVTVIW